MHLKCGPVLQLQATGSSQREKGTTLIGHVILLGQELFTVWEAQQHSHPPPPPSGQFGRQQCAREVAFLMVVVPNV